jgi:phosphomannomutase
MNNEPDGNFPNGIPNPMIEGTRESTSRAVVENKCDLAVAWDGDFDRCFFYDENGEFIEGYYIVGLLAESLLKKHPKEKIIHDPRVIWNTLDIVNKAAGITVMCKSGHTFIKEKMRDENALYGGEMSAHHYFRNFFYCDSGMIPWLLIAEIISKSGKKISEFVKERKIMFPISGEINVKVTDADKVIENIKNHFSSSMLSIDLTDGISLDMGEWRFNIRKSNTEPLLRLNIETRSDEFLLQEKTKLLLSMMK